MSSYEEDLARRMHEAVDRGAPIASNLTVVGGRLLLQGDGSVVANCTFLDGAKLKRRRPPRWRYLLSVAAPMVGLLALHELTRRSR